MSIANITYENFGDLQFKINNFEGAIKEYTIALALNKTRAQTWYNRGKAYMYNGNILEAINDFRIALKLDPKMIGVLIDLGRILEVINDFDQALECYEKALKVDCLDQFLFKKITKLKWQVQLKQAVKIKECA